MEDTRLGQNKVFVHPLDASDFPALVGTLKSIESKFGRVDILINAAGLGTLRKFTDTSYSEVIQPMLIPYAAAMIACHTVVPGMLERKEGHIVNLTSPAGYIPMPYMAPYTSSRHAMVGFSLSLHSELEEGGVGISLLCPGFVNTEYFDRNNTSRDWFPKISRYFSVSEPEEVAEEVIQAILKNKKEVIFPWKLRLFIKIVQKIPTLSISILKFLGLWEPVNIGKTKQN